MTDTIIAQSDGPILRLTLNRPDEGNAVTDEMAADLTKLLLGGRAAPPHRPARRRRRLLYRPGQRPKGRPGGSSQRRRSTEVIFDCYGAFRKTPIPIVCLVHGRALGFGCSIAALADLTLATEDASFQIPEMSHRIMPTMVLSCLIDRLPRKAISHLVYTSQIIGPERALNVGIVGEVVPRASAEQALEETCRSIIEAPEPATEAVKEYLKTAMQMDIQGAVDFARNLHATINSSSEMKRT